MGYNDMGAVLREMVSCLQAFGKECITKITFLFLNKNICCGFSEEPSQRDGSPEHPKHMLKLIGKKIFAILR